MEGESDFFATYKSVSNKLKKKFLKKTNIVEVSEEFGQLAKNLQQKGCYQYAGFCSLAMARCEQNMGNENDETQATISAARYFLEGHKNLQVTNCPNYHEHLEAAKNCYDLAIKSYVAQDLPHMAGTLCLELGNYLEKHDFIDDALVRYQRTVELFFQNPLQQALTYKRMILLRIQLKNYVSALKNCSEVVDLIESTSSTQGITHSLSATFTQLYLDIKVLGILISLLLNIEHTSSFSSKNGTQSTLTSRFLSGDDDDEIGVNMEQHDEELYISLQSFIIAFKKRDIKSLEYLQTHLNGLFPCHNNVLVQEIIDSVKYPSGLGY